MRRLLLGVCAAWVVQASAALAVTNEPDGSQVPRDSKNGEVQLYTLFQNRNDPVDWLADAHTTPATFSPLCNFQATFVLHQAGANRGVGWYNVDPSATVAPTLAQIHVVVPAGTAVGTVINSATIQGDPAYAGGQIGFALVDGQIHYSEQQWNVVCSNPFSCTTQQPWILSVTYQSKSTPNAYYLAFEDGSVDALSFHNDGDFNDDVFFFEGLTCQGGGTPCTTTLLGMCAPGLNECNGSDLVCKSVVQPGTEKCNGVDDDCNGQTDEGDICPTNQVCDHGTCVGRCGGGEFKCNGGKVCNADGYCVDPTCQTVSCAQGTVCIAGVCKAPCDGITCPLPSVCRVGACVDPCSGVECLPGSVCSSGICVPGCGCNPCQPGTTCDPTSQLCVEPACVGVTCGASTLCAGGTCVDPCVGAACPPGEACEFGRCLPSSADAGLSGGGGDGGSSPTFDMGGADTSSGGASSVAGSSGMPPATGGAASTAKAGAPLGCGCRTAAAQHRSPLDWTVTALLVGLGVSRRRRHAARQ